MDKIENSNFKRLVGIWKTSGNIKSGHENLELNGIDSYELILDGNYILHKAKVKMGNDISETFEIFKLQNSMDKAKTQYFDSKGEDGIMTSSLVKNEFNIEGKNLKFTGNINDHSTLITGNWYAQTQDGNWNDFIELKLEKQKSK
ncbi:DUF1579 family protein [Flavobacterium pectinovorum]|uniref:DUF1579 domain-containing protein n=1 Tax=Flavobacterium pectinovorum TaxID=29533 RepID=A0AB36P0L3_9FLAO|nr:DUF1579 family protein [Flavobacterium pectinovorum]OXB04494.1 hypothetical protein B0A72_13460 [Flavobacterium pectinovorum]SHL60534.1 Protein of unknown function [Flavobacterium pectinovorum]